MGESVRIEDLVFWFLGGLGLTLITVFSWNTLAYHTSLVLRLYIQTQEFPYQAILRPLIPVYIVLGLFFLGGLSVVYAIKYRVFSPSIVSIGSLLVSWALVIEYSIYTPEMPFFLYLVGWPLLLSLGLAAGKIENSVSGFSKIPNQRLFANRDIGFITRTQLLKGMRVGGIAYWVTYGFMYIFLVLDGEVYLDRISSHTVPPAFAQEKFAGQVLYNSHVVDTVFLNDAGISRASYITDPTFFDNVATTVPAVGYMITPILVLVGGGFFAYSLLPKTGSQLSRILTSSLTFTLGYLIFSIAGVLLFLIITIGNVTFPHLPPAIIVTGVVYPLLGSGAGAFLRHTLEKR